jgi:hypothetical protein
MASLPPPPINDSPGSFTWLEWYRQLRNYVSTSGSIPWSIINFAGSNITDIATRLHNSLQGLQGGTSGEMYHLSQTQYDNLVAALHNSLNGLQGGTTGQYNHLTDDEYDLVQNSSYAEMYANNAGALISSPVINTWYAFSSGFTGGTNKNFTFQNSHELVCNKAGKYKIWYSLSIQSAVANQEYEFGVTVNGTIQSNTISHFHEQTNDAEFCVSGGGILTLSVNDIVRMAFKNRTSATGIDLENASVTLLRIDN